MYETANDLSGPCISLLYSLLSAAALRASHELPLWLHALAQREARVNRRSSPEQGPRGHHRRRRRRRRSAMPGNDSTYADFMTKMQPHLHAMLVGISIGKVEEELHMNRVKYFSLE